MLSGSPEDMKRIRQAGQLDSWAKDFCDWLQKTFGKENVVSAVLHLDEKTPHIHATVVSIVRGGRWKAKLERERNTVSGKRTYRTKKDRPRLCADDVMARVKLKAYQTTYVEAMPNTVCNAVSTARKPNISPRNSITTKYSSAKTKSLNKLKRWSGRKNAVGRYCRTPSATTSRADRL